MRPDGATFWLLNGATGWRTAQVQDVAVGDTTGVRLAANAQGPLALDAPDGSLGGLVLAQGMAFDGAYRLHVLDVDGARIKRFDALRGQFTALPSIGDTGHEARRFFNPSNIVIAGDDLYVADRGNARIQVFALSSLALRFIWGPYDENLNTLERGHAAAWDPIDVAGGADDVVILDRRYGRILGHRVGEAHPHVLIAHASLLDCQRVAIDKQGRIYALKTGADAPQLLIFSPEGQMLGSAQDAGELLGRFADVAVCKDHLQRFCLPPSLLSACVSALPTACSPAQALRDCRKGGDGLLFDRHAQRLDPPIEPELAGPALYQSEGQWFSQALDSRRYDCQWHRLELDLSDLPAGSALSISTYTDNELRPLEQILALPDSLWETRYRLTGQMQRAAPSAGERAVQSDALVLSHEGQYLWVRLQLRSDGYATPVLRALRVHYPRDSYVQHLPAVFSADDESRRFLERFLSLFQTEWDAMDALIEDIAQYFDPDAVPAGAPLRYLAQWLALPLEGTWDETQQRRLLAAAPAIYPERGTPRGLRRYLQTYLSNITGLAQDALAEFPVVLEGFRQRDFLTVSVKSHAALNAGHALWSAAAVARLQLDVFSREGQARLISTGDPDREVFHAYAHRFHVLLPAAWIKTKDEEAMIERALDAEKPAHTAHTLCLVEPRFIVGRQSSIGMDTIIGAYPRAVLADADQSNVPINQAPRNRLGYDTVLSAGPGQAGGMALSPETRIGVNTLLS